MELSADWVIGFVDGEGDFRVDVSRDRDSITGFGVLVELAVRRESQDRQILQALKRFFRGGVIKRHSDNQMSLRVRNLTVLEGVCDFFMSHPLRSRKNVDFRKFRRIVRLLRERELLDRSNLLEILRIALEMTGNDHDRLRSVRAELMQHG